MVSRLAIGALAILGGAVLLNRSEKDHDDVVEDTFDELAAAVPRDANVYADHLSHRGDVLNSQGEVNGLTHIPDIVVKAGSVNSLLVEVETADSLKNEPHKAREQLTDFSKSGYRRVLVISEKVDDDVVQNFVDETRNQIGGEIYVATPSTVTNLL